MTDVIYSDFSIHKNKTIINEDSIFQSVVTLLNTKKNEMFFNPQYHANLDDIVFKLITYSDLVYFKTVIESRIKKYDPRITEVKINIKERYDDNSVLIEITLVSSFGEHSKQLVFNN